MAGTRLAQSAEHETLTLSVVGSSPMLGGCYFSLVLVFQYSLFPCALLQVTRQFSKEFNLFRSFRSQKSHTSSETKSRKLPGIKELDQPLTSASESTTTTETEDILTVAMESAATQTGSTESSRKSDPDLVLADNTPPADGDDCKSVCISLCMHASLYRIAKGENFHGFHRLMSNLENFNLEDFVLHYNSILCFCNPRNIYHKNNKSYESTKILTLEIFRLYGMYIRVCTCLHVGHNNELHTMTPHNRPTATHAIHRYSTRYHVI